MNSNDARTLTDDERRTIARALTIWSGSWYSFFDVPANPPADAAQRKNAAQYCIDAMDAMKQTFRRQVRKKSEVESRDRARATMASARAKLVTWLALVFAVSLQAVAQTAPAELADLEALAGNPWVPSLVLQDSTGRGWARYTLRGDSLGVEAHVYFSSRDTSTWREYDAFYPGEVWVRTRFMDDEPLAFPRYPSRSYPGDSLWVVPSHVWEALRVHFLIRDSIQTEFPRP